MTAILVTEFDTWKPGYGGATVSVYLAGTTQLAPLYLDQNEVETAANPQTLLTFMSDDIAYGKFERSVYTPDPYQVRIVDNGETTGVQGVPIGSLDGEDASDALVTVEGGTRAVTLAERLGVVIYANDFGDLTEDPQANTVIIAAALGAGAAAGGAYVHLPAGTWPCLSLSLPAHVWLVGQGKTATVLQCESDDTAVTLAGDSCGLASLTLDGVQRVEDSIGLKGVAREKTGLRNVRIRRFETNVEFRGARYTDWLAVDIEDGVTNVALLGDDNASGSEDGGPIEHFRWKRGLLAESSEFGLKVEYEDFACRHIRVEDVVVRDNTEVAVSLLGSQFVEFRGCTFSGNTTWLVADDDDLSTVEARRENVISGLVFYDCQITDGEATFDNTIENVIFDRCRLDTVEVTITTPLNTITVKDCIEREVTVSGVTQHWSRWTTQGQNIVIGTTDSTTPVTAWRERLNFGEALIVTAYAMAVGQNVAAFYQAVRVAFYTRAGLVVPFAGQTANYTLGTRVIGAVSGASGTIQAQTDGGATGSVTLINVEGTFVDDEALNEDGGAGAAFTNLPVTEPTTTEVYDDFLVAELGAGGSGVGFAVSGEHCILQVIGNSSETANWTVRVESVKSRA